MRCPKCGFHSFDYLDSCKKCGVDLTELKLRFKFQGYVAPAAPATVAEPEAPAADLPEVAEAEDEAIDFGFDVLGEENLPSPPEGQGEFDGWSSGDEAGADDPAAIDLAADSGLSLDQPFPADGESVPDDDLPKFGERF